MKSNKESCSYQTNIPDEHRDLFSLGQADLLQYLDTLQARPKPFSSIICFKLDVDELV